MTKLSFMNWVTIVTVIGSIFIHYFINQMDTTKGFAETKVSDITIIAEVEKLKIEVEHLKLNNTKHERDK